MNTIIKTFRKYKYTPKISNFKQQWGGVLLILLLSVAIDDYKNPKPKRSFICFDPCDDDEYEENYKMNKNNE